MSQLDDEPSSAAGRVQYPSYDQDEALFTSFLQQHTILTMAETQNPLDSDDDEDDNLLEPTAGSHAVRRVPCYPPLLQRIKDRNYYPNAPSNTFVIEVPLSELEKWDGVRGRDLADRATKNATRYHDIFCKCIDTALENLQPSNDNNNNNTSAITAADRRPNAAPLRDSIDILQEQRLAQQAAARQEAQANAAGGGGVDGGHLEESGLLNEGGNNNNPGGATEDFPPLLMRRYELRILPMGRMGTLPPFFNQYHGKRTENKADNRGGDGVSLRTVRSKDMGHLVTIKGMIVRASDVKPSCVVATYSCDNCGCEVYQLIENKREFMPLRLCPSQECLARPRGQRLDSLHLQTRGSKFVKFQELKLQELPNQVPMGHIPRSMSVYCRGELTRLASPGDVVTIDGVFLPQRIAESGFRAMKAGLVSLTYLEAQNLVVHKRSYDESLLDLLSEEESAALDAEIMEVATGDDPIGKLSSSIAPEIFGHEDIKRSLLLQLVGGCTRKLPDGMRIRGDINICLMGDPGVAKSQLLKHVASIAPRGVYTTGKGSSGVGLTAAVTKDLATGEMALEGGALVLADRGICCIDEFDKMEEADRTAIHEVMEQQTVSIAKAGIVATLNARAAVLAAANPLYGRYNRSKSLSENVNLPNSLLSRFDLMFLILDRADLERDMALARHVTLVHQSEGQDDAQEASDNANGKNSPIVTDANTTSNKAGVVTSRLLREYIARARKHHPVVPPDVAPYIVEAYVSLRMQDRPNAKGNNGAGRTGDQTAMTARQLLSILRLSQALARLRFSDLVAREDVDEAIRLTHMSKASLEDMEEDRKDGTKRRRGDDTMSKIFHIIRDYALTSQSDQVELKLCEAMVLRKGFTSQQLQACLEEYDELGVIHVNSTGTHVRLTGG